MVIQLVWVEHCGIGRELIHREFTGYTYGGYIFWLDGDRGRLILD